MTTHPLFAAPIVRMPRQNARLALSVLALCTLGLSLSASAQKSAFITFDPPGSIVETIPTSMNPSGAITGWYFDGNIFHGFLRSRQGAFTILDFPGATGTSGASINDRRKPRSLTRNFRSRVLTRDEGISPCVRRGLIRNNDPGSRGYSRSCRNNRPDPPRQ